MSRRGILPALALALALVTCGNRGESLVLSVSADQIAADGMTTVTLVAQVIFRGEVAPDGEEVSFAADGPLLFASLEEMQARAPGAREEGATRVATETQGGVARAFLQAPTAGGDVTIEASFTTINGDVLRDSYVLEVLAPPLISGGDGDGAPASTDVRFGITCDSVNIGGFIEPRHEDIVVPCTLLLRDHSGRDLPHTPVAFFTEAGTIRDTPATARNPRSFEYRVPPSPVRLPRDTEPSRAAQDEVPPLVNYDDGYVWTVQNNPRDGLVTVLAVVRGHEGYEDLNRNGQYDSGEPFIDEGEPFLDVDDDGIYDDRFDEYCAACDVDSDGQVDGPNGHWDEDTALGRMTHILWTGPADLQGRTWISPDSTDIQVDGSADFTFWISDRNYNPLAANDVSDDIRVDPGTTRMRLTPATLDSGEPLPSTTGMVLASFPEFKFGHGTPVFKWFETTNGLLAAREWTFSLADDRSSGYCDGPIETYVATARVRHTPAADAMRMTAERAANINLHDGTSGTMPCP